MRNIVNTLGDMLKIPAYRDNVALRNCYNLQKKMYRERIKEAKIRCNDTFINEANNKCLAAWKVIKLEAGNHFSTDDNLPQIAPDKFNDHYINIGKEILSKYQTNNNNSLRHSVYLANAKSSQIVIGGSILDSVVSVQEPFKVEGRTLSARIRQFGGGVGRNLADALGKLNLSPCLVTAVGNDQYGNFLLHQTLNHLDHEAVLVTSNLPTACYTVLLDQTGEFRMGLGDMEVHSLISSEHIFILVLYYLLNVLTSGPWPLKPEEVSKHLQNTSAVIMDGNSPPNTIRFILEYCSRYGIPVIFEPTDVKKAAIPFQFESWKCLRLISPNVKELREIAAAIGLDVRTSVEDSSTISIEEIASMAIPLAEHIQTVMVTLGARGVLMVGRLEPDAPVTARYYATTPLDQVTSVSGAGDCYAGATSTYLKRHALVHKREKPYKCSLCSYSGASSRLLKSHMDTHASERAYKCSVCSYTSTRPGDLRMHKLKHSDEKPYKCTVCSYTCKFQGQLNSHIKYKHTNEKAYKCSLCSYATTRPGDLRRHTVTHTGDTPYKCTLCSYSSARSSHLKRHALIHRNNTC
ncbi:hypothetical protein J6590_041724 [Homalodisca vitripennis]|nr:hypothetical protein J6590_041724 [Homalodisca vitripennis]